MEKLITPFGKNHFFGYYDKSPLNDTKKFLLSHEVTSLGKKLNKSDEAKICLTNLENKSIRYIETSKAWNYQQGSQLQWLSKNKFIFNSYEKKYIAKIFDSEDFKFKKILENPIYSISDDKKIYSSIDYSRIHKFREGYGYLQVEYKNNESLLKICDVEDSRILLELYKEDFKFYSDIDFDVCWIDHILFAPNGYDFTFLLRSMNKNRNLFSYLFYYNFKEKKLVNVLDTGMAGHGSWLDETNFIIWARNKNTVKKISQINNNFIKKIVNIVRFFGVPSFIRKNIYGDNFLKFNKSEGIINELKLNIATKISGGHFSFFKDKNLMLSDTYHNEKNQSELFIYDFKNESIKFINKFSCPKEIKDKSYRCDLHPRIISENEIIIDSTHEGFRGIYSIKI